MLGAPLLIPVAVKCKSLFVARTPCVDWLGPAVLSMAIKQITPNVVVENSIYYLAFSMDHESRQA